MFSFYSSNVGARPFILIYPFVLVCYDVGQGVVRRVTGVVFGLFCCCLRGGS